VYKRQSLILILNACANEETKVKELTFEDIEKGFGFERPLSEKSRETVMQAFASLDAYRTYIINAQKKISEGAKNKKSQSSLKGMYIVSLKTPDGQVFINCTHDTNILDAAEWQGIDLPYSCRAGACSTCAGKCTAGDYDDSNQSFLDEDQRRAGYCLLCVTYPCSAAYFDTHQEEKIY
jgi:ferredoxin